MFVERHHKVICKIVHMQQIRPASRSIDCQPRHLVFTERTGIHIIPYKDIIYCEAAGNYTKVHLNNGVYHLLTQTLKKIESRLPDDLFLRVHQSYLVQLNLIRKITENELHLSNESVIPIARRKRKEILSLFIAEQQ